MTLCSGRLPEATGSATAPEGWPVGKGSEEAREGVVMMKQQRQGEIAELNGRIEELEDPRERYALVQERIRQYRKAGAQVPEDLRLIERSLMRECLDYSQGR